MTTDRLKDDLSDLIFLDSPLGTAGELTPFLVQVLPEALDATRRATRLEPWWTLVFPHVQFLNDALLRGWELGTYNALMVAFHYHRELQRPKPEPRHPLRQYLEIE